MTIISNRFIAAAIAATLAGAVWFGSSAVQAQALPPVLLVLDKDGIDYGPPPHLLPEDAVDPDNAGIGVRDGLHYFQSHVDSQVVLPSGNAGNDGWFALRSAPIAWDSSEGANDGLKNFAIAGPGLGSPDDNGDRESLLSSVSDVVPIRADGLAMLVGRTVCALVYSGDITVTAGSPPMASLQGPTLGRMAFSIVSLVPADDLSHPQVQVQIADWSQSCGGDMVPFADAP
jgi:hypothetical protein